MKHTTINEQINGLRVGQDLKLDNKKHNNDPSGVCKLADDEQSLSADAYYTQSRYSPQVVIKRIR